MDMSLHTNIVLKYNPDQGLRILGSYEYEYELDPLPGLEKVLKEVVATEGLYLLSISPDGDESLSVIQTGVRLIPVEGK